MFKIESSDEFNNTSFLLFLEIPGLKFSCYLYVLNACRLVSPRFRSHQINYLDLQALSFFIHKDT